MIRRRQYLTVTGHPGAGKTTALQQFAPYLVSSEDKPLPISIKLPRACRTVQDAQDVTAEILVADAVRHTPAGDQQILRASCGQPPRPCEALAGKVVEFWDSAISVFIEEQENTLTPRSRVFADLADAMWVEAAQSADRVGWIDTILNDETRIDNFILATMKCTSIADLSLEVVHDRDRRRLLIEWLCNAASESH
jgi:hypothetical protein